MITSIVSSDPNFRPSDVKMAPTRDLLQRLAQPDHRPHAAQPCDPNRNRVYGRVYRITYDGRPLSKSPQIEGATIPQLLDALKSPEDRVRYRARLELSSRKTEDVLAATSDWISKFDKNDKDYEHHLLEGLWVHQNHNVANRDLLKKVLAPRTARQGGGDTRVVLSLRSDFRFARNPQGTGGRQISARSA